MFVLRRREGRKEGRSGGRMSGVGSERKGKGDTESEAGSRL